MIVVSTFPAQHADIYGSLFLEDCERWNMPLVLVHYEDFAAVPSRGERRLDARRHEIGEDVNFWKFRRKIANVPFSNNYRYQVHRFSWKAFAMTREDLRDTPGGPPGRPPDPVRGARWPVDWLIWLDADVRITAQPNWSFLNDAFDVCYLGRKDYDHSETGFLAWNLRRRGDEALDEIRRMYTTLAVLREPQWHDAWVFDRVRERLDLTCLNLSPRAAGLDAWEASPLATWSRHLKGNRKFTVALGETVS